MARLAARLHIHIAMTVLLPAVGSCAHVMRTPQELAPASPGVPGPSFNAAFHWERWWETVPIQHALTYVGEMPFEAHRSAFSPEDLQVLQKAFELAWGDIALVPIISSDPDAARELLAQRIVAAARKHGERDPERLKRLALKAFET